MVQDAERSVEQLNKEADIAADFLEGLLDIADYDGDIEMGVQNGRPVVQIVADDDSDIKGLVGSKGEVVDALQQLARLAVQQKTGERSHLILDVDGYLKRKRIALKELAMEAIRSARSSGDEINLPPMNSFERKIIHDVVREEGMKSRSHGEEPHRHVTVFAPGTEDVGTDASSAPSSDIVHSDTDNSGTDQRVVSDPADLTTDEHDQTEPDTEHDKTASLRTSDDTPTGHQASELGQSQDGAPNSEQ